MWPQSESSNSACAVLHTQPLLFFIDCMISPSKLVLDTSAVLLADEMALMSKVEATGELASTRALRRPLVVLLAVLLSLPFFLAKLR